MVSKASSDRKRRRRSSEQRILKSVPNIYRPQATMVFLKVTDGKETRRFQVTSELTFDQLRERLIRLFPSLGQAKDLLLKYRDAEGDLITLSSNEELQEVLAHTPDDTVWKLHIKTNVQEPSLFDHLSEPFWRPFGLFSWGGFDQELRGVEELLRQRRRQCERVRIAAQTQKKATDSGGEHETSAEPTEGTTPSKSVPDDEAVKSKTSSGGQVFEHKPQWHCRVIGSWEPRIYEGLFGHRTVVGPVGYHLWWGNSDTDNRKEDSRKEAAPEQTQQESRETQQEPSENRQDLNETQTSTTETAASAQ